MYCKICGKHNCKEHSFLIGKTITNKEFSGSSPPEIFVGHWNYPNVYSGILAPTEYGNTEDMSSPELWHKNKFSIDKVISLRQQLIYGRSTSNVKNPKNQSLSVMQEIAMTHKSIATNFRLKDNPHQNTKQDNKSPLITSVATIDKVKLEENPSIKPKIEYIVNDTDAKATTGLLELYSKGIENSTLIKLLSAGLLGRAALRKLVPTRWAITAVDDTLSKEKLKRIKLYQEIGEILLFHAEYVGNHYEFLLLPDKFSFEVLEMSLAMGGIWHDYESFFPRKKYADDVTGAYYVNRLALTEYLEKIKRQCSCIVFRTISAEYSAPLGVGILRETSREAFRNPPEKFNTISDAIKAIEQRTKVSHKPLIEKSIILKEYGKQKRLTQFF